jgi:hypothetical protein
MLAEHDTQVNAPDGPGAIVIRLVHPARTALAGPTTAMTRPMAGSDGHDPSAPSRARSTMMRMPRLAWFTPFPPDRSDVAACGASVLPLLAHDHEIVVFVHPPPAQPGVWRPPDTGGVAGIEIRSAHDFPWRHARAVRSDRVPNQWRCG